MLRGATEEPPRAEPVLEIVTGTFHICSACLDGAGGECHTPGCVLWLKRAPDLAIRDSLQLRGCKVYRLGQEPTSTPPDDLGGVPLAPENQPQREKALSRWLNTPWQKPEPPEDDWHEHVSRAYRAGWDDCTRARADAGGPP